MSYFTNSIIYVIVPVVDVTIAMENCLKMCFNSTLESTRKTNDGTLCLLKLKDHKSAIFSAYSWYNGKEILEEMEDKIWNPAEV